MSLVIDANLIKGFVVGLSIGFILGMGAGGLAGIIGALVAIKGTNKDEEDEHPV